MTELPSQNPRVSVLMPVYNAEAYLADAVQSVLGQTFADFEFIIVDDGSTDSSLEILRKYEGRDDRIRLISRANTGYLVALNEMIDLARGGLLARMDSDDVCLPTRFERQVDYLDRHLDCVAVGSKVRLIDPDGDPLAVWNHEIEHEVIDRFHLEGERGAVICHPSVMMRAKAVESVGGYREAYYTAEDLDLFLRLAEIGRLANLDEPLLQYRMHGSSICHSKKGQQLTAIRNSVEDARRRRGINDGIERPDIEPESKSIEAIELWRKWGWWALNAGYVGSARKWAWRVFRRKPFYPGALRLLLCSLRGR